MNFDKCHNLSKRNVKLILKILIKRFGMFKGLVEQKNVVFNSLVCQLDFFGTRGPKNPNLHKNSSDKLLFFTFS
jgi:hypothetical protein